MFSRLKFIGIVFLIVLWGVGCLSAVAVENTPPPPTATAVPTQMPLPTATVVDPTRESEEESVDELVQKAISDLQERRLVKAEQIEVQDVTATDFSDASLGVPEPGKMYAQVITPGYVVRLQVGQETYVYHASSERVVLASPQVEPTQQPVPPAPGTPTTHRIEIGESGLSILVPSGWLRLEPEWAWTPAEGRDVVFGVRWADLQPPQEAEAVLLPGPSQILQADPLSLSWGGGRLFTIEVYEEGSPSEGAKAPVKSVELHALVVTEIDGTRRAFDLYATAPSQEDLVGIAPVLMKAIESATLSGVEETPTQTPSNDTPTRAPSDEGAAFQDEEYGFELLLPVDWTWQDAPAQGPGTPDDWPVVKFIQLYPQTWDAQINRSGPPDPTAKVVVAPLQVEVVIGDDVQFRRAYPEPTSSEEIEINGLTVTMEREVFDPMSITRYVFGSPADPKVRITITDQLSGFPDRIQGNDAVAEQAMQVVQSMRFTQ